MGKETSTATNSIGNEQKVWLVSHSLTTYEQHRNLIGNIVKRHRFIGTPERKKGVIQPATSFFQDIKNGDIIAYYDRSHGFLLGLFEVVSKEDLDIEEKTRKIEGHYYLVDDDVWDDCMVYYIKPHSLYSRYFEEKYFDFKRFLKDKRLHGELEVIFLYILKIEKASEEENQKDICRAINCSDIKPIFNALTDKKLSYFVNCSNDSVNEVDVLSPLLDFYNNRTTSFANLFLASIFGIVTLSAIVESIDVRFDPSNVLGIWQLLISIIPYFLFAFAGYYTFQRYRTYADTADKIKTWGFEIPYHTLLNKRKVLTTEKKEIETRFLANFIIREARTQNPMFRIIRKIGSYLFALSFAFALLTIGLVVYWNFLFLFLLKEFRIEYVYPIIVIIMLISLPIGLGRLIRKHYGFKE